MGKEQCSAIITEPSILANKSEAVSVADNEQKDIIYALSAAFNEGALGLAAPQVGIFKRVFLASLCIRREPELFAFVNPDIKNKSKKMSTSVESCLSIPNVTKTILRHYSVDLHFEEAFCIDDRNHWESIKDPLHLTAIDSFVVQHENDHLDGILITDHADADIMRIFQSEELSEKKKKVKEAREKRKARKKQPQIVKMNPKKLTKMRKMQKAVQKKNKNIAKRIAQLEFMKDNSDS